MKNARPTLRRCGSRLPWLLFAFLLTCLGAEAQTRALTPAGNPTASAAEITAFMQAYSKDPKAMFKIEQLPNRVPLLLGAMERDPKGPFALDLLGCWLSDRNLAFSLPPASRAPVYRRAIEYLTAAKTIAAKALAAEPENKQLEYHLSRMQEAIARANGEAELAARQASLAARQSATNAAAERPRAEAAAPNKASTTTQACINGLRQIELAKEMWMADNPKRANAVPKPADLLKYFPDRKVPECPEHGSYLIGTAGQRPRCTMSGHQLPPR